MAGQDIQLYKTDDGYFDTKVDESKRDFAFVEGFETAISTALFTDARAHSYQVSEPVHRRGFIGDLINNFILGSLLWTFAQARITQDVINKMQAYVQKRMEQFVDNGICSTVEVTVQRNKYNPDESLDIIIIMDKERDSVKEYSLLWGNTKYAKLTELSRSTR